MLFDPLTLAVLLLAFVGGLAVAFALTHPVLRFVIFGGIFLLLVAALVRGFSPLLERVTHNLASYFWTEPIGTVGLVLGFLSGLYLFRGRFRT